MNDSVTPDGVVKYYCRFDQAGECRYGQVLGDKIKPLDGAPWCGGKQDGDVIPLASVGLTHPVCPGKIIGVGLNYQSHLGDRVVRDVPGLFAKFPNTIIGSGDIIPYPPGATLLQAEGELVIVIGKTARNVSLENVSDHIFGVTCGNDVSERNWQKNDLQWTRAKSSDGFGPIGPMVARGLNYRDLELTTRVNGEVVQNERTSNMIFSINDIVAFASNHMTLDPGDLIFTGTPGTTATITPDDLVEVEIEDIGILSNMVQLVGRAEA